MASNRVETIIHDIRVVKQPGTSKQLAYEPVFNIEFNRGDNNPQFAIFHTRAATQGTKNDNNNNHPLVSKKGIVLIHNGIINNDGLIKRSYNFDGQVDSEAILRIYEDEDYKTIKEKVEAIFTLVSGSYACAIIDKEHDKLVLFRHNNPIDIAYDEQNDILYFASDIDYITDAVKSEHKLVKRGILLRSLKEVSFPDDALMIVGPQGVEEFHNIKYSAGYVYTPRYTHYTYDEDDSEFTGYGTYGSTYKSYKASEHSRRYGDTWDMLDWVCDVCGSECLADMITPESNDDYSFWLYENNVCPECAEMFYQEQLTQEGIYKYKRTTQNMKITKSPEKENEKEVIKIPETISQIYD